MDVYLPATWNRRFLMRGNGGFAGVLDVAGPRRGINGGFAVAVTDAGHNAAVEPLATFAVHPQKLYDYAFRSLHVTVQTARRLIERYYGEVPSRSYYNACSTGGRQGLMFAQRFPEDFDGIIAGAPVLDFTGTMLQYASTAKALEAAALTPAKTKTLASAIYARCDGIDGLRDGLIDDPKRCDFSPSRDLTRCAGAETSRCFTGLQIAALERIYSPVQAGSRTVMPGWPVGAEMTDAEGKGGWSPWIVGENEPSISFQFAESFFRYMAFPEKNAHLVLTELNLDSAAKRLEWLRPILDATDPDLTAFRARGGKLIMYFGLADPALNAERGIEYAAAVHRTMGAGTDSFFRFFAMPGVFHCGGGPGCGTVDLLPGLVDWVERGKAPDALSAAQTVGGKAVRARPLCNWPQVARYRGAGSVDEASSFVCASRSPEQP